MKESARSASPVIDDEAKEATSARPIPEVMPTAQEESLAPECQDEFDMDLRDPIETVQPPPPTVDGPVDVAAVEADAVEFKMVMSTEALEDSVSPVEDDTVNGIVRRLVQALNQPPRDAGTRRPAEIRKNEGSLARRWADLYDEQQEPDQADRLLHEAERRCTAFQRQLDEANDSYRRLRDAQGLREPAVQPDEQRRSQMVDQRHVPVELPRPESKMSMSSEASVAEEAELAACGTYPIRGFILRMHPHDPRNQRRLPRSTEIIQNGCRFSWKTSWKNSITSTRSRRTGPNLCCIMSARPSSRHSVWKCLGHTTSQRWFNIYDVRTRCVVP